MNQSFRSNDAVWTAEVKAVPQARSNNKGTFLVETLGELRLCGAARFQKIEAPIESNERIRKQVRKLEVISRHWLYLGRVNYKLPPMVEVGGDVAQRAHAAISHVVLGHDVLDFERRFAINPRCVSSCQRPTRNFPM